MTSLSLKVMVEMALFIMYLHYIHCTSDITDSVITVSPSCIVSEILPIRDLA